MVAINCEIKNEYRDGLIHYKANQEKMVMLWNSRVSPFVTSVPSRSVSATELSPTSASNLVSC